MNNPSTASVDPASARWNNDQKEVEVKRTREGDGCAGVVVMDMVGDNGDWDLVRLVVGLNMGILTKVKQN